MKNSRTFFGCKGHTVVDDNRVPILRPYVVTSERGQDSTIDLSKKGITVNRDKGYFGNDPKGVNGTMDRTVRDHKLPMESARRNRRISRKRSLVEHPYAIMNRVSHLSHVLVNLIRRVRVKFTFACFV